MEGQVGLSVMPSANNINELETMVPLCALLTFGFEIADRNGWFFVDNKGTRGAFRKGYSSNGIMVESV